MHRPRVSLDDLASDVLEHRRGELFAPPGLTNFLGTVQVDEDPVAVTNLTFPPFACGDTITARAHVDGRLVGSFGPRMTVQWRPDRVVRTARLGDLDLVTTTVLLPNATACVVTMGFEGGPDQAGRVLPVCLVFAANVVKARRRWNHASPPSGEDNSASADPSRPAVVFRSRSGAVMVQGVDRPAFANDTGVALDLVLDGQGRAEVNVVLAVGDGEDAALETWDDAVRRAPGAADECAALWQAEIESMFLPGNGRHGGSLPVLETTNPALERLYYLGALGVLYFRRDSPWSVIGRTYDTLMPRYWASVTFLWDYYLSTRVHALLEPDVMRRHLEHWIVTDTHTHFGTNWLTGETIGNWYSVNDLAMTRMISDYVAWTGDVDWLGTTVDGDASGLTVAGHVDRFATAYERLVGDHGMADYGRIDNLLECVSTYLHAVASFNAGNVWCLRRAAEVDELLGDSERAERRRQQAKALAAAVNELYVDGQGFWRCRYPDGSEVEVRHVLDFFGVPLGMLEDLSETQQREIADFFVRELQTPLWMHALSPFDPDAVFSVRPDHQWNGAYPAWPPESALALLRMGRDDIVGPWLDGLAASGNQGPWAQAHFAEDAVVPHSGGARKAPPQLPWITDWACSSNGSWVGMVIDGVFGVEVGLDGSVSASPRLAHIDPDARLRGLVVRGVAYDVDAAGVHAAAG